MNNQVLNSDSSPRRSLYVSLIIGILILAIVVMGSMFFLNKTDAYTEAVLKLEGDPVKGRSIFVMNCVACHGQWADGKVGPSLKNVSERLSKSRLIHQVVSGETPPMPQFQPAIEEMADLLSYLSQL
ncbi:cytochrome c, mono- and diheme variants family [Synechococcus sp. PCC 7502]|uniref:c-type cytochrome n=1 Tax=Synechococcus sp. PCC 7502 TaxID=1173263 RepID=UPI00029F97CC|nr:cytochrome c [Synechococcus sp. PCC 7502]AFY72423.1 cytochrome c, mono- and diheme variants family [Synechococcus sp. PCC 7502]